MKEFSCEIMTQELQSTCPDHDDPHDCPDRLLLYSPKFDEYGILIHDGGTSRRLIFYCPWCGVKLPPSQREGWFDTMEKLGIDPWEGEIPEEYRTDAWYKK